MKIYFNLESYSPIISNDVNVDNHIDGESYTMLLRLLQFFQILDHERKEKDHDTN